MYRISLVFVVLPYAECLVSTIAEEALAKLLLSSDRPPAAWQIAGSKCCYRQDVSQVRHRSATAVAVATDLASLPPPAPVADNPALAMKRPYRERLRQQALAGLDEISNTSKAALAHETRALLSRRQQALLWPMMVATLSLLHPHISLRSAVFIFLIARFLSALVLRAPFVRDLLSWPLTLRAALRGTTFALEAAALFNLAVVLAVWTACTTGEIAVRRLPAGVAWLLTDDAPRAALRTVRSPAALWAAGKRQAKLRRQQLWKIVNASAEGYTVDDAHLGSNDDEGETSLQAHSTPASTDTIHASAHASSPALHRAAAVNAWWTGVTPPSPGNATEEEQAAAIEAAGEALQAQSSAKLRELYVLLPRTASQAMVHFFLSAAAAIWACEAASLLVLALGQRIRLLVKKVCSAIAPRARTAISNLPRSREEFNQQLNSKLNVVGLQWEASMAKAYAGFLDKRSKWIKDSSSSDKASGNDWADNAGLWWDRRVLDMKSAWVSWQLNSTKANRNAKRAAKDARRTGKPATIDVDAIATTVQDMQTSMKSSIKVAASSIKEVTRPASEEESESMKEVAPLKEQLEADQAREAKHQGLGTGNRVEESNPSGPSNTASVPISEEKETEKPWWNFKLKWRKRRVGDRSK